MKKFVCFFLIAVFVFSFSSCKKQGELEEIVETPVPTAEIVSIEAAPPTPSPEPVYQNKDFDTIMNSIVISDADVDSILNDDVNSWEGFSVKMVENPLQTVFYIIPEDNSDDETKAIGSVIMICNENAVSELRCSVFTDSLDKNMDSCRKLFDYLKDEFPVIAIGNMNEEIWKQVEEKVLMDFDSVAQNASNEIVSDGSEEDDSFSEDEEFVIDDGISVGLFSYIENPDSVCFLFKTA